MTARVSRNFVFDAGMHYDNSFVINTYHITLHMEVITEDVREQNIALERMKFILESCLENSILLNSTSKLAIAGYLGANLRVCTLPDEPYDQIIAAVIMSKLNVITEEKIAVTEISIKSNVCDDVVFHISRIEDNDFHNTRGVWWTTNDPSISDLPKKSTKKDKVVQLRKDTPDWAGLGLGWKEVDIDSTPNEIVFINSDK